MSEQTNTDLQRNIHDKVGVWLDAIEKQEHGDPSAKIVPFDDLWKWAGYNQKSDAKKALNSNCRPDIDFSSKLLKSTGGRPKEELVLTVDAAKKFLIRARTPQGDAACDYFIQSERQWRACRNAIRDGQIAVEDTATGRRIDNSARHERAVDRVESCEATKRTCRVAHDNMPDADRAFYVQKNLLCTKAATHKTPKEIRDQFKVKNACDILGPAQLAVRTAVERIAESMAAQGLSSDEVLKRLDNTTKAAMNMSEPIKDMYATAQMNPIAARQIAAPPPTTTQQITNNANNITNYFKTVSVSK